MLLDVVLGGDTAKVVGFVDCDAFLALEQDTWKERKLGSHWKPGSFETGARKPKA